MNLNPQGRVVSQARHEPPYIPAGVKPPVNKPVSIPVKSDLPFAGKMAKIDNKVVRADKLSKM